jgi:hypothetical protein
MDSKSAFRVMGSIILVSSFLSVFVAIPGQNGLVCSNGIPDLAAVIPRLLSLLIQTTMDKPTLNQLELHQKV